MPKPLTITALLRNWWRDEKGNFNGVAVQVKGRRYFREGDTITVMPSKFFDPIDYGNHWLIRTDGGLNFAAYKDSERKLQ